MSNLVISQTSKSQGINSFFSLSFSSLKNRCIVKWQNSVLITAITISVIAAVASFFMSAFFVGGAFSVFAGALACRFWCVHGSSVSTVLQKNITVLKEENQKMQKMQNEMELSTKKIEDRCKEIQQINKGLEGTVAELRSIANELQTANHQMAKINENLDKEVNESHQTNQSLQQKLDSLVLNLSLLKAQVEAFTAGNISFGQNLSVLDAEVVEVSQQNAKLSATIVGLDVTFDENISQLSLAVRRGQNVSDLILARLSSQKNEFEINISELRRELELFKLTESQISQHVGALDSLDSRLQADALSLEQANKDLQIKASLIEKDTENLSVRLAKLNEIEAHLASQTKELALREKELEAFPQKFNEMASREEARLKTFKSKKNQVLNEIDRNIVLKSEELKKINEAWRVAKEGLQKLTG